MIHLKSEKRMSWRKQRNKTIQNDFHKRKKKLLLFKLSEKDLLLRKTKNFAASERNAGLK